MFIPFHDENPTRRTPVVTYILIAVNVLAFVWTVRLPYLNQQMLVYQRGFVPARIAQLTTRQPIVVPVEEVVRNRLFGLIGVQRPLALEPNAREIWFSLFTCMFLHGSWLHLIGNMWFLYLFGNNVEDRLGPLLYLILYLVGGLIASASHWLFDPKSIIPVIGASGAVAAVLGAYTVTWPWARVHTLVFLVFFITVIEVPALVVNGVWFLAQVIAGQESLRMETSGGVAWWAHVGGFIAGALLMPLFSAVFARKNPPPIVPNDPVY
ncbi:MAG TPA: rhomboid family intramembrane serine protease [Thermoguttaceae bacterium]